jgi:hypothetical protein
VGGEAQAPTLTFSAVASACSVTTGGSSGPYGSGGLLFQLLCHRPCQRALPPSSEVLPLRQAGWATASRTATVLGSGRRLVAHTVRLTLSRLSGPGRARRGVGGCAAMTVVWFFFGVAGGAPPASPRCRSSGGAARGAPSGRPAWGDLGALLRRRQACGAGHWWSLPALGSLCRPFFVGVCRGGG